MKRLIFAVLLAVSPSALMAQLSSLENAAEKTKIAVNSDDVTAKELTAVPFDGTVTEGGTSVVATGNGSSESNKKDIVLATSGKKTDLVFSVPGPKENGVTGMLKSESGSASMEMMGMLIIGLTVFTGMLTIGLPIGTALAVTCAIMATPLLLVSLLKAAPLLPF